MHASHTDLQGNLIEFCRRLRERDLLVTPMEVVDALRTADTIDLTDRTEMQLALRTVLTARHEDLPLFDAAFDEFWRSHFMEGGDDDFTARSANLHGHGQQQPRQTEGQQSEEQADERHEGSEAPQRSPIEVVSHRDFIGFAPDELTDIRRAMALVARRLATQRSRRYRSAARHGQQIDLRRTFRRNIKYGGTVLELARKERKVRNHASSCSATSVAAWRRTPRSCCSIYALQHSLGHVESFVFSTA